MNDSTDVFNDRATPSAALVFDHLFVTRDRRRPRPVNWFRIAAKLLAFALGCLLSLVLGTQDYPAAHPAASHHATPVYGWGPRPAP